MVSNLKYKYKYIIIFAFCIVVSLFLFTSYYIRNYVPRPVTLDQVEKVNFSTFFPSTPGLVLTYANTPDKYGVSYFDRQVILPFIFSENAPSETGNLMQIYNYDGVKEGSLTYIKTLNILNNSIKLSSMNESKGNNPFDIYIIDNTPKWKINKNMTCYITATNLTVNTNAGEFKNCIEITSVKTLDNNSKEYSKTYSTPDFGYIMKKSGSTLKDLKTTYELYSYSLPSKEPETIREVDKLQQDIFNIEDDDFDSHTYYNESMGISLKLPDHWNGNFKLSNILLADNIEKSITFNLSMGNKINQRIFSIHMLKDGYKKEYVDNNKKYIYIGEHKGKTLVYSLAKDFSSEVEYNTSLHSELNKMLKDVPSILSGIEYKEQRQ